MKLTIRTHLNCSPQDAWQMVQTRPLLEHITAPIMRFGPVDEPLPTRWKANTSYVLRPILLGIIPLGRHVLRFVSIDQRRREIVTDESNGFVRRWQHTMSVEPAPNGGTRYADQVEIDAGPFTEPVALFASLFYRYRQYRWRKLAPRLNNDAPSRTPSLAM